MMIPVPDEDFNDAKSPPGGLEASIRVHLTHDCPIVRAGLTAILHPHTAFVLCHDGREPRDDSAPSVVITDYATGVRVAAQSCTHLRGYSPKVLVLTNHAKEWEVRQAVSMGVNGYLLQDCSADELLCCVRQLGRGIDYLTVAARHSMSLSLRRVPLTPREGDVLRVLAQGGSDKDIALALGIGSGTVKSHIKHLLVKLDATARTHAVVVAMRRGLLSDCLTDLPQIAIDADVLA